VYGEPRAEHRYLMWETLHHLHAASDLPWMVIGDFNETMWGYEHFSPTSRPARQMDDFRRALADCDLTDLGFSGLPYTYDNGHLGVANVHVRLDRDVEDPRWRNMFTDVRVQHVVSSCSDLHPKSVKMHGKGRAEVV
jgi:hypothetical protein